MRQSINSKRIAIVAVGIGAYPQTRLMLDNV